MPSRNDAKPYARTKRLFLSFQHTLMNTSLGFFLSCHSTPVQLLSSSPPLPPHPSTSPHKHHLTTLADHRLALTRYHSQLQKQKRLVLALGLNLGEGGRTGGCGRSKAVTGGGTQFALADIELLCLVLNIASIAFKNISACVFSRTIVLRLWFAYCRKGKSSHQ